MNDTTRPLVTKPDLEVDDRGASVCCGSTERCHDCPFYKPPGVGPYANSFHQPSWLNLTRDDDDSVPGDDDR